MVVKQCVDWLSYTVDWDVEKLGKDQHYTTLFPKLNRLAGESGEWMPCTPRNGYTCAFSMVGRQGLTVMWNPDEREMGVHINWSGSALQGIDYVELSKKVLSLTTRIGRIDLAVDTDKPMNLATAREQFKAGQVKTLARKCKLLMGEDGDTLYIGSRTSEKYLRIYDKAAQQGIDGTWFRIELECKGEFARGVFMYLFEMENADLRPIIRGFCDFPDLLSWQDMAASPTPTWTMPQAEKRGDREKWLLEGVAPALADMLCSSEEFRKRWFERMYALLHGRVGEVDIFDGMAEFDL